MVQKVCKDIEEQTENNNAGGIYRGLKELDIWWEDWLPTDSYNMTAKHDASTQIIARQHK